MSNDGKVVSVNISAKKGTAKHPVDEICLDECGIIGDAHVGTWHRQVSLLSQKSIDRFAAAGNVQLAPEAFGGEDRL